MGKFGAAVSSPLSSSMLRAGLIGFPSTGKTTLFQLLTSAREAHRPSGKPEANVGVSRVPDERLDRLTALFNPRKRVPATVEFADIAGTGTRTGAEALLDVAPFRNADALLHVIDASHPDWEDQMLVVEQVLAELELTAPVIPVFNKVDLLPDAAAFSARVRHALPEAVFTTTMRTDGLASLKASLRELAQQERPVVTVRVPVADGARLAELYRVGQVLSRRSGEEVEEVVVRLEPWQADRLAREGLEVVRQLDRQRTRATG